jgi:hypothetical protein
MRKIGLFFRGFFAVALAGGRFHGLSVNPLPSIHCKSRVANAAATLFFNDAEPHCPGRLGPWRSAQPNITSGLWAAGAGFHTSSQPVQDACLVEDQYSGSALQFGDHRRSRIDDHKV